MSKVYKYRCPIKVKELLNTVCARSWSKVMLMDRAHDKWGIRKPHIKNKTAVLHIYPENEDIGNIQGYIEDRDQWSSFDQPVFYSSQYVDHVLRCAVCLYTVDSLYDVINRCKYPERIDISVTTCFGDKLRASLDEVEWLGSSKEVLDPSSNIRNRIAIELLEKFGEVNNQMLEIAIHYFEKGKETDHEYHS